MHMFPSASYQVVFKFKTGGILLDPKPAPDGLGSLLDPETSTSRAWVADGYTTSKTT
jgi:hypothetical protein